MELPSFQEVVQPIRELSNLVLEKLGDWVIGDAISDLFNGVQEESAKRTAEMFTQGELFKD